MPRLFPNKKKKKKEKEPFLHRLAGGGGVLVGGRRLAVSPGSPPAPRPLDPAPRHRTDLLLPRGRRRPRRLRRHLRRRQPAMAGLLEGLEVMVREGSFRWALPRRNSLDSDGFSDGSSPSTSSDATRIWVPELSTMANQVVGRCSKVIQVTVDDLRIVFDKEASDLIRHLDNYARSFVEFCCFRALSLSTQSSNYLDDKCFRQLTFDMMLAWEAPSSSSEPVAEPSNTVGVEAFSRIAPAIPTIADVITSSNLFDALSSPTDGRLSFVVYDKYLIRLNRALKKMKSNSDSSLLSALRSQGEKIIEVDGTLGTQPVFEHIGTSAWPGRLTLTDHALYFEALKVVTYDKPKVYDLASDLNQVIKPDLTGPWGSRLFDKAVMYKSVTILEPVIMEFPELTGHSRRDYWLAIMNEILYAHTFIRRFNLSGLERDEALLKAVLGILRVQAIMELTSSLPKQHSSLMMFNLCDKLPGGDLILETLADTICSRQSDPSGIKNGMHSLSTFKILSNIGVVSPIGNDGLLVGDIVVGEKSSLEKAVSDAKNSYKLVEQAQATVDGVKVDGLDTNLAVMKDLIYPLLQFQKVVLSLALWDDPRKSIIFCCLSVYIILRGWLVYIPVMVSLFTAVFMLITRFTTKGKEMSKFKVVAPPPMNTMEQLLAVQNAISQVEVLVQDANIVLLKLRALLLAFPTQATDRAIVALLAIALTIAFVPTRLLILAAFLELFTMNSPARRVSTERSARRFREWWFSIPAASVVIERETEDKKKR